MPRVDGYEASIKIREFLRENNMNQPKIIACTGHIEEEYKIKAWRYQIDEIISKPIKIEIAILLLSECMNFI